MLAKGHLMYKSNQIGNNHINNDHKNDGNVVRLMIIIVMLKFLSKITINLIKSNDHVKMTEKNNLIMPK